jgi:photosystem II stability/assembly factor-like uncharacterized protein
MSKKIIIVFSLLLVATVTMGAGCSISLKNSGNTTAVDGGFWVSLDKGVTWQQSVAVPTISGVSSISSLDDSSLAIDPKDTGALYFGSLSDGLYYTFGLSNGWTKADSLKESKINSVAVSPNDKCVIYAAAGNKIYRSNDCNRTWTQIYYDNDTNISINVVAVDFYNAGRVYFGNSRGDIGRSNDGGDHWVTVLRTGSNINDIVFNPDDSRKIFVATSDQGIYRTADAGENWTPLEDKMKDFKNSFNIIALAVTPGDNSLVFAATTYGLLKSSDFGNTWLKIDLVTPEEDSSISSLAVNAQNPKEIYYVTNTTFYSSSDGGASWRTKKLPSTRAGRKLLIKPDETNVIFLTVKKTKEQNTQFGL